MDPMCAPILFLYLLSTCAAYHVSITHPELFQTIEFYKSDLKLPDFLVKYDFSDYLVHDIEGETSSGTVKERVLRVDTGSAYFDTIRMKKKEFSEVAVTFTVVVEVLDKEASKEWRSVFGMNDVFENNDNDGNDDIVLTLDRNFITSPPFESVQIIDTMQYNGDFIALFHIEYLYEYVDKFIVVEGRYTHSGKKKPYLYFHRNIELFAPYMDKILYVVVEEFAPVPPPSVWSFDTMRFITPGTEESYWNENYQYTFPRFFIQPSSEQGCRQLVLVSDADEISSRELILYLKGFESDHTLPLGVRSFDRPVHILHLFFYYNFDTVNSNFWIQNFALNSDSYLEMDYPLDMRSFGFRADYSYYPGGYIGGNRFGWHLSYFMSLPDMIRKVESFSAAAEVGYNDDFKTEEHIRYCMKYHKDIFNRSSGADWVSFFDNDAFDPHEHLPEGWKVWQEKLRFIQDSDNNHDQDVTII